MAVRTKYSDDDRMFYITFTCFNWLPLIAITNSYDLVYKWFNYLHKHNIAQVTGFVIMPNHLHCTLFFPYDGFSLANIIGNAKRFMAYEIIKRLKKQRKFYLLSQLVDGVKIQKRNIQQHKVFKNDFDAKAIRSTKFLEQKLSYMHLNPVRGNYNLVDDWRDYPHSSAGFYEFNKIFFFTPFHHKDLT